MLPDPFPTALGENTMTPSKPDTHAAIWAAIDELIARKGMPTADVSRAAMGHRRAFKPSCRKDASGKPIWPGMQSVSRVLSTLNVSFLEFGAMVETKLADIRHEAKQ